MRYSIFSFRGGEGCSFQVTARQLNIKCSVSQAEGFKLPEVVVHNKHPMPVSWLSLRRSQPSPLNNNNCMQFSPHGNKEKFARRFGFFLKKKVDLTNVRSCCTCWKQSGDELGREETLHVLVIQSHLSFLRLWGIFSQGRVCLCLSAAVSTWPVPTTAASISLGSCCHASTLTSTETFRVVEMKSW